MKIKVIAMIAVLIACFSSYLLAETLQDQQYINQLNYNRNKLELLVKTRLVSETNTYSSTDWTSTTYSQEAYSQTYGKASTNSGTTSQTREITVWKVVKGGVRQLTDAEFLETVGKHNEAVKIADQENTKSNFRLGGLITSLAGVGYMLIASGQPNNTTSVSTGGLVTLAGFLLSAFNQSPWHYITSDYAQELIDNYNIDLKRKLNLPVSY